MRESSKAALCGIISALSVVILLLTYLSPFLVYTAPAFSGLLLLLIFNEIGYKWGLATYFSVSFMSLFIVADKESAVFFTMLFGYYPMLSCSVDSKINKKFISYFIKFFVFNLSCLLSMLICIFVIGISFDDIVGESTMLLIAFIVLLNLFFIIYDILINRLQLLYLSKWQKSFRKIFNISKKG